MLGVGIRLGAAHRQPGPLTVDRLRFPADLAAGAVVARLSRPFGATTRFAVESPSPPALVLDGRTIRRGLGPVIAGGTHSITIRATDSSDMESRVSTFIFTVAAAAGGGDPIGELRLDTGFFDDFETPGPIAGRAGWALDGADTEYWRATGGTLKIGALYKAEGFAYPAAPLPADQELVTDFDFAVAASEGTPFHSYRTDFRLWWSAAGMIRCNVQPEYSRVAVSMISGAAQTNLGFVDGGPAAATQGRLSFRIQRGILSMALNGASFGNPVDLSAYAGPRDETHAGITMSTFDWPISLGFGARALRITVDPLPAFQGRDPAIGGRLLALGGSCSGAPDRLLYRVRDAGTGTIAQDWRTLPNAIMNSTAWSADAFVPEGGPWLIDVGGTYPDGVTYVGESTPIAIGVAILYWGQSNADGRQTPTTTDFGGATPAYSWRAASQTWVRGGTVAAATAHALADRIGIPAGAVGCGVPSQLLQNLVPTHPNWTVFTDRLAAIGGHIEAVVIDQGEADAFVPAVVGETRPGYAESFRAIVAGVRAATSDPTLPVFLTITGKTTDDYRNDPGRHQGTTLSAPAVRAAQAAREDPAERIWVATHKVDSTLADSVHYTAAAMEEIGRREGLSIAARAFASIGPDGRGPMVTGASRAGPSIILAINLNGATALSGTALTGYEVSADGFATLLPIATATVEDGGIRLTLTTDPAEPVQVRSYARYDYDDSSVAIGSYDDGTTIPVLPISTPLVVA